MQTSSLWRTLRPPLSWLWLVFVLGGCSAQLAAEAAPPRSPRPLPVPAEGTVPAGFALDLVTKVPSPTALAFAPDGRMLITTQPGRLFVSTDGSPELALDLSGVTCTKIEQGMLGVEVDPAFASNQAIYLFYTVDSPAGCHNRVSRFTLRDGFAHDEHVLLDGIPSPKGNHNAGDLNFGPDGYLYVSTGDGGCDHDGKGGCDGDNDASRDRHVLGGKILRITSDGEAPSDNPFVGPDSDRCAASGRTQPGRLCRETYAEGLRNPYRFAFDPGRPRLFINDVGQDAWEEINEGVRGADYGWNLREGGCTNGSFTNCPPADQGLRDPLFDYSIERKGGCHAITGAAFVPPGVWPEPFSGRYLFGDFGCGAIFQLVENAGEPRAEPFARGLGDFGVVHLEFGPFGDRQALYFTTYEDGGAIYRIVYEGTA